jgi:hypothetical protein
MSWSGRIHVTATLPRGEVPPLPIEIAGENTQTKDAQKHGAVETA